MKTIYLLGVAGLAGAAIVLGQLSVASNQTGQEPSQVTGSEAAELTPVGGCDPHPYTTTPGVEGPNVAVFDLPSTWWWANDGDETAYSFATTSCNRGDRNLDWIDPSNRHPVIGQNMYRLKDGRFEQIGLSWLKHSFFALQLGSTCGSCSGPGGCLQQLWPGCSDPYSAFRNGVQSGLGPRWEVDAHDGVFCYPFDQGEGLPGDAKAAFRRRCRVKNVDLDPDLNPGAQYYIEGQYVTRDDSVWGNQDDNTSYREVNVNAGSYTLSIVGGTEQFVPAMTAWQVEVPGVTIKNVRDPEDGLFKLGYRTEELPGDRWAYEYALYNMHSDRSARSFSIPIPPGVTVTNEGFHDVDHHSGDGEGGVTYDGTDWTIERGATDLTWSTDTWSTNPNANALRWGTLYNFRFVADAPPTFMTATVGLFKPGDGDSIIVSTVVPMATAEPCDEDIDGSGAVDFGDILEILSAWGDPEPDLDGSGEADFGDLLLVLSAWGPCP